ncbi:MAG: hypothetical protein GY696_34130 [Gammaproteobacteria bacterium]|nr:hypothetical protein [Gammaproteobacteria bacterium]
MPQLPGSEAEGDRKMETMMRMHTEFKDAIMRGVQKLQDLLGSGAA